MDIQELKEQVIFEVNNLKKYATKEELSKLDFDTLNPESKFGCIYGQMTGNCFCERADSLVSKCTKVYYDDISTYSAGMTESFIYGTYRNLSPIEVYISLPEAKNKTLIDYLKGDRDSLTTKDL